MGTVVSNAVEFCRGISGAIVLAAAAISDPLRWLHAAGFWEDVTGWPIEDWQRQTLFAALAILWMFVWFHRQRVKFDDSKPAIPDMPLHRAARYLARDSEWAAQYPHQLDGEWVTRVDHELMSKLNMGHVYAFGIYKPDGGVSESGMKDIPFEFFPHANWNSHHLISEEPPTHMWRDREHGGGVFRRIKLNRKQVENTWPRRSIWKRFMRKSPVERLPYDDIFRAQDENYRRLEHGGAQLNVFDEMFEEGSRLAK